MTEGELECSGRPHTVTGLLGVLEVEAGELEKLMMVVVVQMGDAILELKPE